VVIVGEYVGDPGAQWGVCLIYELDDGVGVDI